MKKKFVLYFLLLLSVFAYSCKKELQATKICLHDSSVDYLKRWAIVLTETDERDVNGAILKKTIIYPNGYFQINSDFTYNLYSDGAPVNGKWNINANCQFVLNPNTVSEHKYSVMQLSADSLTIAESTGSTTITQHYASFNCPSLASLEFRWDNAYTLQASYQIDTLSKSQYIYAVGYFKLNADASYNVFVGTTPSAGSNVTAAPVINGTWGISQPGCLLILDKNKPNERSYDVERLTTDSLIIWRKDTVIKMNYLQHYSKHK
jgi:hypothetical protein